MAQAALRHIVLGLATTGLLMGCVETAGTGGTETGTSASVTAPARGGAARDVEAPEVFQTTDSALWDGRPSLGGIWVAAPEVENPERVIMFNPANGKSVQGALFRRERDNPGPRLQISSDAADALGILAGQPVEIRVTALRREEPAPEPETQAEVAAAEPAAAEADADADKDTAAAPAPTSDGDADAAATAAAATAALAATGAVAAAADGGAEAATQSAAPDAAAATEPAAEEAPKRKTWKERRAEAKAAREAKRAEAAAAKAAAAAGTAPEVAATAAAAGVAAVETAPLDAGAADASGTAEAAAAPATEAPPARRQIGAEDAAAAKAAADAEVAAEPTAEAADTTVRQIQVASFSSEANATRAVQALSKINITAQTRKSETGGKVVWGVVTSGDAALLQSIKDAGFADAFFLQ